MSSEYKLQIPIKNVYYMLSYAYGVLKQDGFAHLGCEEFENIYELLSEILIRGISEQLKRGIYKEYTAVEEDMSLLRGKMKLTESLRLKAQSKSRLYCIYDEFSSNNILNQILKMTCLLLIKNDRVKVQQKKKLKQLLMYFRDVNEIRMKAVDWSQLNYHRNNQTYRMLMNICYLIWEGLIVNEDKGKYEFINFIKDKQMAKLFEKFVYEFYRLECPEIKTNYQQKINWITDDGYIDMLPGMNTDISLTQNHHRLIIDTKFYFEALQKNYLSENRTLISGNMYQIFTYVKNSDFNGKVSGMLLYPTVEYDLNQSYKLSGNDIFIRTIDLGKDFSEIAQRLMEISKIVDKDV